MKHRQQLRRVVTANPYRASVVSAAVLAVGLTTGIMLTQNNGSAAPTNPETVAVAERLGGQAGAEVAPSLITPSPVVPTPSASSAAPAPAAPSSAPPATTKAPATPVKAVKKAAPPASKVLDYDYEAQINGWYCGPAAARIALTARDRQPSQDDVAAALGTTFNGTNSADDTTRGLNALAKTDFYRSTFIPGTPSPAQMDRLQADVVHAVSSGYAVVANIVGSATDVDGGWHAYDGGHYLTVVGYRDSGRTVQIADPAYVNGVSSYWMTTIDLANWMATRGYSA
ncbi:C39 family peptidase [Micromonospora sp. NBC_01699]|uniref:C39 family peptidase n=1 Tax=Micromonospora sp. NBC_01699 TaxID=2975984 RepID=UPI002E2D2CE9|nr:C39 family peptidase [Micromonospora sp. NBC_01699]